MRQRRAKGAGDINSLSQELTEGAPVFDRDGNKIGSVDGYDARANILAVRKGLLFPHDFYAPLSAIRRASAEGVHLKLTEEDLRDEGYAVASQAMSSDMAPLTTSQTVNVASGPIAPYPSGQPGVGPTPVAPQPMAQASVAQQPVATNDAGGEITVPLAGEQLVPHVEAVPLGNVRLHKGVRTVERQVTVPVGHDEVVVEHIAPDQFDASQPVPVGEIVIPILEERVITQTVTVVKEYLRVRTQRVVERQEIRAQTRQEYLDTGDDHRYVETREAHEHGDS